MPGVNQTSPEKHRLLKSEMFLHMDGWSAEPEQTPTSVFGAGPKLDTHLQRHSEPEASANIFTHRCYFVLIRHRISDPMKYECFETHSFCKLCARRLRHIAANCMVCVLMCVEIRINFRHAEVCIHFQNI